MATKKKGDPIPPKGSFAPPNNNDYQRPKSINIGFTGSMDWDLPPDILNQAIRGCHNHLMAYIGQCRNAAELSRYPIRVHVGDNPKGVDPMVIHYFTREHKIRTAVYGVNHHWRNLHEVFYPSQGEWITRITGATGKDKSIFYQRDAYMLKWIQVLYAVWNGESKGTLAQYRAALKHPKIVPFLVRFEGSGWVIDKGIEI